MRKFFGLGKKGEKDKGSGQVGSDPKKDAKGKSTVAPGVAAETTPGKGHNDDARVASPQKQVAFASLSSTISSTTAGRKPAGQVDDDEEQRVEVQSLASHHGLLSVSSGGVPCIPNGGRNPSAQSTSSSCPHSMAVPSAPLKHISMDTRDATLRPSISKESGSNHFARGDLPKVDDGSTNSQQGHGQPHSSAGYRSATSMSHATTSTAASSSFSQNRNMTDFYLGNNQVTYPNLAVLATYAKDMTVGAGGIAQHLTWGEITSDELVDNIGKRERTRQEVLFEMVCSEERYVQDLTALRDNYLEPLLRSQTSTNTTSSAAQTVRTLPSANISTIKSSESIETARPPLLSLSTNTILSSSTSSPASKPPKLPFTFGKDEHVGKLDFTVSSFQQSSEYLPIASRFARRTSVDSEKHPHRTPSGHQMRERARDASGGTNVSAGTGGVTSAEEEDDTDAGSSSNHHHHAMTYSNGTASTSPTPSRHQHASCQHDKEPPPRLQPFLSASSAPQQRHMDTSSPSPPSTSAYNPSTSNVNAPIAGQVHIPKAFRHHLRSLAPAVPNKLHKASQAQLSLSKELPLVLSDDLKVVCEVIMGSLLEGHRKLSENLRKRYEEQYPLVRTLADVFTDQAWLMMHYATYVLSIEKAMSDVDSALASMNPMLVKSRKKDMSKEALKEEKRVGRMIMRLEEQAAGKGTPGLAICLSQPFQRLLKYPLLFQSLLYHTDPSTRDYEATSKLAFEIDSIVRSIENEKISAEERAKTRDCWARIEGITDKALLIPRADRVLVSEVAMWNTQPAPGIRDARRTFSDAARNDRQEAILAALDKPKKTKRLSDQTAGSRGNSGGSKEQKMPSVGSKRDCWLVTFTDVVIRCQRVGVTHLPIGFGSTPLNKAKANSKSKIHLDAKNTRNLYKFQKIDHWVMDVNKGSGLVDMNAVVKHRTSMRVQSERMDDSSTDSEIEEQNGDLDVDEEDEREDEVGGLQADSFANGGDSRMSFTYSNDAPRPAFDFDPLIGLTRTPSTAAHMKSMSATASAGPSSSATQQARAKRAHVQARAMSPTTQQVMRKQGAANAKFGNRIRPSLGEPGLAEGGPFARQSSSAQGTRAHTPAGRSSTSPHAEAQGPASRSAVKSPVPQDRGRPGAPSAGASSGGFYKPTAASLARAAAIQDRLHGSHGPTSGATDAHGKRLEPTGLPEAKRVRAASNDGSKRIRATSSTSQHSNASNPRSPTSPQHLQLPKVPSRYQPGSTARRSSYSDASPAAPSETGVLRKKHSSDRLGQSMPGHHKRSDVDSGIGMLTRYWQAEGEISEGGDTLPSDTTKA